MGSWAGACLSQLRVRMRVTTTARVKVRVSVRMPPSRTSGLFVAIAP